jgi:hypothetical protein
MTINIRFKWSLAAAAAALFVSMPGTAQAFECPKHFVEAWAAIERVDESMKGMEGKMAKEDIALVLAHLRGARMSYVEAKMHHTQTSGAFHHTRAIVRAHEAMGHALAAEGLHRSLMGK